ncbi:MAG: hypothetical protein GX458_20725 [Phyllobacteriaceae bacterium]|nr:hypothetical protein [Phyllobacteriaceae bacterium]
MSPSNKLSNDIACNLSQLESDRSQTAKRNLIRSLTAYIEFMLSDWKEYIPQHSRDDISEIDLAILDDKIIQISDDGEKRKVKLRTPIRGRMIAKLKIMEKFLGDETSGSYHKEIEGIDVLFRIRDKITHPKSVDIIDISDKEMNVCISSTSRFLKEYTIIGQRLIERTEEEIELIKRLMNCMVQK